jgi:sterol desaturase/sphingolipid hydroxylase (fatty acid hydroxylase superfamily)
MEKTQTSSKQSVLQVWIYLIGLIVFIEICAVAVQLIQSPDAFQQSWLYKNIIYRSGISIRTLFTNPATYICFALILWIERLLPAKRNQKILSVGFAQDTIWFLFDICSQATIIFALTTFWKAIYQEHFSFLTIKAIENFPFWLQLTIGILVADFAGWLHHYLRHKIWWMWPFHALHHSQKELNLFTDVRYHVFEYAITAVTNVFFISIFTMNPYAIIYYSLFHNWYTKLCHANIRSNFGPFKYILITPQSHRVHHSIELRHRDKNLGILLSIWDYLFGTQYRKYDEYPDTGIEDEHFPHEKDSKWWNLISMPVKQHLYPFQAISNILKQKKSRAS